MSGSKEFQLDKSGRFIHPDPAVQQHISIAELSMNIYERTLIAMGLVPPRRKGVFLLRSESSKSEEWNLRKEEKWYRLSRR